VSLAKSIPIASVPPSLVKRLKRLRQDAAAAGLRIEVDWKQAKPRVAMLTGEQQELVDWISEQPEGATILDASIAFGMSIQAMGNRLQRLLERGVLVRDAGRPARWKVKQGG
jgi:hypothetical protein